MKRFMVVTGASSGMGWDFALQLAQEQRADAIWLVARRREQLEALASSLGSGLAVVHCLDLSNEKDLASLIEAMQHAVADGWVLDCLVNNAGFGTYGPFVETDLAWQLGMIDLNVRSLTALAWHAAHLMDRGARLINVASLAAFMPLGNFAVYAATKAYVLALSVALAAELRPKGVLVHALCPGPVATEFAKVASGGARQEVLHGKDAKRVVAHCLRQVARKRTIAVYAWSWKLNTLWARLFSRNLIARLTYKYLKKPHKHD